jgi:aspartyl aminopeptidase
VLDAHIVDGFNEQTMHVLSPGVAFKIEARTLRKGFFRAGVPIHGGTCIVWLVRAEGSLSRR